MARAGTQFAKLTGDYSSINVYATWQLLSQDKDSRSSTIRLREYLNYSYAGTYGSSYSTFKLNGTTVKSGSYSYSTTGDHLVGYKDITVQHNEDGTFPDTKLTAYAYSYHFTGKPSKTVTLTSKDIPDIEVGSTINNITENWYDENYGVPNGVLIDANLVDGYMTSLYATVNGTEYLLSDNITNAQIQVYFDEWVYDNNQEIEAQPIYASELSWQTLCKLIPNSASIDITFTLKSTDGANESANSQTYTFVVSKASFSWQPYLKADDKTNELTGSDTTFIENFSKLTFDSNVFGSLNGATVNLFKYIQTKYTYDISDVLNPTIVVSSLTQNNTSESSFVYDDIGSADDKVLKAGYKATIVDSRGFETTCEEITIPSDEYPVVTYEQPKLISVTVERTEQTAPYVDVNISGSFWKDNFGAIENELTLQYRYKLSTASDYIDWAILEPKINEDGTFSYNGTLGSEDDPLIPSDASAVFEIRIIDSTSLESTIKDITVPKGKSMYDWGENYFSWNGELCINDEEVPCFIEEAENEDGSRQVQMYDSNMKQLFPNIFQIGDIYVSSENIDPATRFGGTWELIDKQFKSFYTSEDDTWFTPTSGTNTRSSNSYTRDGHSVRIRIVTKTSKSLTDTDAELGTIDLEKLGMRSILGTLNVICYINDDALGIVAITFNTGELTWRGLIGEATNVASEASITIDAILETSSAYMLDEACDKFYWKRAA